MDFKEMSDSTCTARVTKLMKQIISKGTGLRGQRDFTPVLNSNLFKTLLFSENITFDGVFPAPSGDTHFKVINNISILSEYKFNTFTEKYELQTLIAT